MDLGLKRSLVTAEQLNTLLDFMKEHPDLAQGLSRGRRGKLTTVKVWAACAKKLNAILGANKNGKGWSKYWCDWKYRVRRHALELKAAREANQTGPDTPSPLTTMEHTIMDIIGESALDGIIIKADPLADDSSENEQNGPSENYETRSKRRKINNSAKYTPDSDDNNIQDSGSLLDDKTKVENGDVESEDGGEAAQFLDLEKRKLQVALEQLEATKQISVALTRLADVLMQKRRLQVALEQLEATKQISVALTRLADVLMQVKDILINNNTGII